MYVELGRYAAALRTYITSTYHISHPALVELRDDLLARQGAIAQTPYIESTARYAASRQYATLSIPQEVRELLTWLGEHVAWCSTRRTTTRPTRWSWRLRRHTETSSSRPAPGPARPRPFLLPILGRLAAEAATRPSFSTRAVRALLLYPMNALVNDQLGRLRVLFGGNDVSRWFTDRAGRPMKFARYTGRTLYPGRRSEDTSEHWSRLKQPIEFFTKLEDRAASDPGDPRTHRGTPAPGQVALQAVVQPRQGGRGQRVARQRQVEGQPRQLAPHRGAQRGPRAVPAARSAGGRARPPGHQLLDAGVHAPAAHRAGNLSGRPLRTTRTILTSGCSSSSTRRTSTVAPRGPRWRCSSGASATGSNSRSTSCR
jgi:hypothetical protein